MSSDATMESIADQIGCTVDKLREFVTFCDDNLILEKRNGRLFCQFILDRMNEFARKTEKAENPKEEKNGKSGNSEKTEKAEIPIIPRNHTTQSQHNHNTKNIKIMAEPIFATPEVAKTEEETQEVEQAQANNAVVEAQIVEPPPEPPPQEDLVQADVLQEQPPENTPMGNTEGDHSAPAKPKLTGSMQAILSKYKVPDQPKKTGISYAWQDKAFRYADYLKINLPADMKPRWLQLFKQASVDPNKAKKLEQTFTYLSDYQPFYEVAEDKGKVMYFFELYNNGIGSSQKQV